MKKPWQYIINQFLNSTKRNYKKALALSTYHDAALLQKTIDFPLDTDWTLLYERYHPLHVAFKAAYNAWVSSGGTLRGFTLTLKQLFKLMPAKLDLWISLTIPFYPKTSSLFISLFKNRKPFTEGKTDPKINALSSLSTAIGSNLSLAPMKAMVDSTYALMNAARIVQSGGKSTKSTESDDVETTMGAVNVMAYRNVGFLINKWADTPEKILPLYDLETLRKSAQTVFKRKMKVVENSNIVQRTMMPTDEIRIKTQGVGSITDTVKVFLASTPNGMDSAAIAVTLNRETKVPMSAFGVSAYSVNKYFVAVTSGNSQVLMLLVEFY